MKELYRDVEVEVIKFEVVDALTESDELQMNPP